MGNALKFEKIMTRDAPLVVIHFWSSTFSQALKDLFGFSWPEPLFLYRNGTVESWRPVSFREVLPEKIFTWIKDEGNKKQFLKIQKDYLEVSDEIESIKNQSFDKAPAELLKQLKHVESLAMRGLVGLIPSYWMIEWESTHGFDLDPTVERNALRIRRSDTLFDDLTEISYKLLDSLAGRLNWPVKKMKFLLPGEIAVFIKQVKEPDWQEVQKREGGYFYYKQELFLASELEHFLVKGGYRLSEPEPQTKDELKGQGVGRSKVVQGAVKKVLNREQTNKVRTGDILVAPMTTPWYLPIMKKASAFVTDEGGMMSHAAIIAREMRKPCIIGTKVATKVFKDGDMVEVDAERGIVRKV